MVNFCRAFYVLNAEPDGTPKFYLRDEPLVFKVNDVALAAFEKLRQALGIGNRHELSKCSVQALPCAETCWRPVGPRLFIVYPVRC
jgi:hypothetical protein